MTDKEITPLAYDVRSNVCDTMCEYSNVCTRKTIFKIDGVCYTRKIRIKVTGIGEKEE